MGKKQIAAILLSAVLGVVVCFPVNCITAIATAPDTQISEEDSEASLSEEEQTETSELHSWEIPAEDTEAEDTEENKIESTEKTPTEDAEETVADSMDETVENVLEEIPRDETDKSNLSEEVDTVVPEEITEDVSEGATNITVAASGDNNTDADEPYDVAWQTCGDNAIWTYYSDGTVRITGTGAIELVRNSDGYYLWDYFNVNNNFLKVHTVIVEEGITDIGSDMFAEKGVSPLFGKMSGSPEKIILADSVKTIGLRAFHNCSNLETIVFGSGVSSLGQFVFSYCPSLKEIIVSEDNATFKSVDGVLFSKDGTALYKLPGCGVTDYTIPKGVTSLMLDCMADITTLNTVSIPGSVQTIENYAFDGCDNITMVFYGGAKADWRTISIGEKNDILAKVSILYDITSVLIRNCNVSVNESECAYSGSALKPRVTVTYKGMELVEGEDYQVEYKDNINVGTAKAIITGKGDFRGTKTATFTISDQQILPGKTTRGDMFNLANNVKVTWKEVPGAKYYKIYREGITDPEETRKDPVIVTDRLVGWDKEQGLTNGHAYRYKIVASLTGAGDPSGDSTLSYSKVMYRLKTVVIRSVKNTAPGKVTVKYDKTASGDSYVLQYCEREDMVGAKTKVVLGANSTSYTIGGLKKGKTYYISIRVRKKVDGIDYYTTFGVPKKIKITK